MKCKNLANFRLTWPGKQESFYCRNCFLKLKDVVNTIKLPLQLTPLNPFIEKIECRQEIKE